MKRLASLDALRGFDMFFIMGGGTLVCTIAAACGIDGFSTAFGHAEWDGLHFMDLVFPLFLFIAGVSFPFSAAKSLADGASRGALVRKALRRGLTLVALGWLSGGLLRFDFATFRVWSVLGRIGLAWMLSAGLYLAFGTRVRLAIAASLLILTGALTLILPAPDANGASVFSAAGNLGCWLDRTLTAGHCYRPAFDPEGFAGLLPAIVTAMFGVFAGELVRAGDGSASGRKAGALVLCAVVLAFAGSAAALVIPVNKALWSPSFALLAGAISFAVFALFYWVVDVLGCTKGCEFFRIIGLNSITIYIAQRIVSFGGIRDFFLKGLASKLPVAAGDILLAVGYIAVCWLFLLFLHRQRIYLKV